MEKSNYQKVEGILYRHYNNKLRRDRYKRKIVKLERQKLDLKKDIHNCNIEFSQSIRAMDYSTDKIVCSSINSTMEKDIELGISKLEKQYAEVVRDIIRLKARHRNLELDIEDIDTILHELPEESLKIIDLKYGSNKTYREIGEELNAAHTTIIRKQESIIEDLINILI